MSVRALVMAATLMLAPPTATAFPGDQAVFAGVSYDRMYRDGGPPGHGLGSLVGWRYSLSDDWNLWSALSYAGFVGPKPSSDLAGLALGAAYVIDAVSWVPEVHAGVGFFSGAGSRTWEPDVAAVAGLGLEYRRFREFGVGFRGEYRLLCRQWESTSGTLSIALYSAFHF